MQEKFPKASSKQNLERPSKKGARTISIFGSFSGCPMLTYRKNQKKPFGSGTLFQPLFNRSGFNLIEIVLALVLFAVAVPAVGHLFAVAYQQEAENTNQGQAIFLATALMDEISERRYRESSASATNCVDAGEISGFDRTGFDDVDDYAIFESACGATNAWNALNPPRDEAGNSLADYSKFSQNVSIYNVSPPSMDPVAAASTDFKMVTVTISWNNAKSSIQIHKLFARNQ